MRLLLLHLVPVLWRYSTHNAGNALVAAFEDFDSSVPGSSDISFLTTEPLLGLDFPEETSIWLEPGMIVNNAEEPSMWLEPELIVAHAEEDIFAETQILDDPYILAFNMYPPPENFEPCPVGKRYACCDDVSKYEPYEYECIWYDYDIFDEQVKKEFCQDQYIYCCGDIKNDGYQEKGIGVKTEGFDCEPATRSTFTEVLPAPQQQQQQQQQEEEDQIDWTHILESLLFLKHPLFQLPTPAEVPE